ncbi:MAG TPA: division/cell wall cluster transcriptional repressor MraZ [Candidatus Binataceae bacterium]|nr:division/cell wall cluster transcriptional repressor MraZ [Candidatus Binataceae bacterium]
MFSGRFDHAIDDKGRISLPAKFREQLERDGHDRLYITNFIFEGQHCLEAFPPNEWSRLHDQIRQRARFDLEVRAFELFYIGGAHEVLVDKQGRILVPPKLREFATLKGEVTFSALADHFQLWDKAILEEVLKATEARFSDPEFFKKLGL